MSLQMKNLGRSICLLALLACGPPAAEDELLVFAAASLRDAFTELAPDFERRSGLTLRFNFAGSNVLAQQLAAAPRADVFASADESWMDFAAERGLLLASSRRLFLSNRLVVVAPRDAPWTLETLSQLAALPFRHLALADPRAVPAGVYARQALEGVGKGRSLWSRVEERVVPAADVRAALAMVAAREDTVGVVYRSDAAALEDRLRVLLAVPAELTPDIRYSVAVIGACRRPDAARAFVDFLFTPAAQETFIRLGFEPIARDRDRG